MHPTGLLSQEHSFVGEASSGLSAAADLLNGIVPRATRVVAVQTLAETSRRCPPLASICVCYLRIGARAVGNVLHELW